MEMGLRPVLFDGLEERMLIDSLANYLILFVPPKPQVSKYAKRGSKVRKSILAKAEDGSSDDEDAGRRKAKKKGGGGRPRRGSVLEADEGSRPATSADAVAEHQRRAAATKESDPIDKNELWCFRMCLCRILSVLQPYWKTLKYQTVGYVGLYTLLLYYKRCVAILGC